MLCKVWSMIQHVSYHTYIVVVLILASMSSFLEYVDDKDRVL